MNDCPDFMSIIFYNSCHLSLQQPFTSICSMGNSIFDHLSLYLSAEIDIYGILVVLMGEGIEHEMRIIIGDCIISPSI